MKIPAALILAAFLALFTLSALAASAPESGAELVGQHCGECHSLSRVCAVLGTRDAKEWFSTVNRMVNYGMVMAPGQSETVARYLSGLEQGAKPICE